MQRDGKECPVPAKGHVLNSSRKEAPKGLSMGGIGSAAISKESSRTRKNRAAA